MNAVPPGRRRAPQGPRGPAGLAGSDDLRPRRPTTLAHVRSRTIPRLPPLPQGGAPSPLCVARPDSTDKILQAKKSIGGLVTSKARTLVGLSKIGTARRPFGPPRKKGFVLGYRPIPRAFFSHPSFGQALAWFFPHQNSVVKNRANVGGHVFLVCRRRPAPHPWSIHFGRHPGRPVPNPVRLRLGRFPTPASVSVSPSDAASNQAPLSF